MKDQCFLQLKIKSSVTVCFLGTRQGVLMTQEQHTGVQGHSTTLGACSPFNEAHFTHSIHVRHSDKIGHVARRKKWHNDTTTEPVHWASIRCILHNSSYNICFLENAKKQKNICVKNSNIFSTNTGIFVWMWFWLAGIAFSCTTCSIFGKCTFKAL